MKFRIDEVIGESIDSVRTNPVLMLPMLLATLAPYIISITFARMGLEPTVYQSRRGLVYDADDVIAFITYFIAFVIASAFLYGWLTQATVAVVREGRLRTSGLVRLLGGTTARVSLSLAFVWLMLIGLTAIMTLVGAEVVASRSGLVLYLFVFFSVLLFSLSLFSLTGVACAFERCGPLEAVSLGAMRLKGSLRYMIAFFFIVFLFAIAVSAAIGLVQWLSGGSGTVNLIMWIVQSIIWIPLTTVVAMALAHIYAKLQPAPEALRQGKGEALGQDGETGFEWAG